MLTATTRSLGASFSMSCEGLGVPSPSIQTQGVGHLLGHLQFFFDFFHAPTSTNPHSFQRLIYIRYSESDGLAHFEVGDETGHAPVVELAAADFQMTGEFLFGHQVDFGARRRWVRFHAHCCCVNVWPLLDRKI